MSGQTQKNTRTSIILKIDIIKDVYTKEVAINDISYIPIYTYKGNGSRKYKILNIERAVQNYEKVLNEKNEQNEQNEQGESTEQVEQTQQIELVEQSNNNDQISESDYTLFKTEIERLKKLFE